MWFYLLSATLLYLLNLVVLLDQDIHVTIVVNESGPMTWSPINSIQSIIRDFRYCSLIYCLWNGGSHLVISISVKCEMNPLGNKMCSNSHISIICSQTLFYQNRLPCASYYQFLWIHLFLFYLKFIDFPQGIT